MDWIIRGKELRVKVVAVVLIAPLISGCYGPFRKYQPQWVKSFVHQLEGAAQLMEDYKTGAYAQLVGKSAEDVVNRYGAPDHYSIDVHNSGWSAYYENRNTLSGLQFVVDKGRVVNVIRS